MNSYPRHNAMPAGQPMSVIPRHADNVLRMNTSKSAAAAILGSSTSEKKARTSAENGKEGGRPKGS